MSPNSNTPDWLTRNRILGAAAAVIVALVLVAAAVALSNDEAESAERGDHPEMGYGYGAPEGMPGAPEGMAAPGGMPGAPGMPAGPGDMDGDHGGPGFGPPSEELQQCLSDNGIDLPDPGSEPDSSGMPSEDEMHDALEACQQYLPSMPDFDPHGPDDDGADSTPSDPGNQG